MESSVKDQSALEESHHALLGRRKSASADDIRRYNRKLALQYPLDEHSDDPKSGDRSKRINGADALLSDENVREIYRASRSLSLQLKSRLGWGDNDLEEPMPPPSSGTMCCMIFCGIITCGYCCGLCCCCGYCCGCCCGGCCGGCCCGFCCNCCGKCGRPNKNSDPEEEAVTTQPSSERSASAMSETSNHSGQAGQPNGEDTSCV